MKILRFYIFFFLISMLNAASNALPRFSSLNNPEDLQNSQEEIDNTFLLNQRLLLKQKQNDISYQNRNQPLLINESTKQNLRNNSPLNKQSFLKSNFDLSFKKTFKDLSKTYVSPFGKPINRAPDESLMNCQSKECYE